MEALRFMLLKSISHKSFALAVLAAMACVSLSVDAARAEGPFSRFAGRWHGDGKISMSDGTKETIRCRVTYAVANAGTALTQNLLCASQSYKFDVSSQVQDEGGRLTGSWTETTRNVTGSVSGAVRDATIIGTVMGATFSAGLSLAVRGATQYVRIRPEGTTDVTDVTVVLRRG